MKKLNSKNLEDLGVGCAILGSGGGGDHALWSMMSLFEMEKTGPVSLINLSELKSDDVILPIGFMGAPSAETEKIASGREFDVMLPIIEESIKKKITVLMPFEIGGGNAFIPVIAAAKTRLPVLDADLMARAFPEAQMTSSHFLGVNPSPGFITDCLGNTTVIYTSNTERLENIGRQIAVAMGSAAAFAFFPMTTQEARKCTFQKTFSKALAIGKAVREARANGKDPIHSILALCKGVKIGSGKITDIDRVIARGFLYGKVTVQNRHEKIEIDLRNEFLVAKKDGKIVATTPDILTLMEQETGAPIASEQVEYGLKVHLIALPAPQLWTTPEGLALVGPRHFGYETDYHPISHLKQPPQLIEQIP